MKKYMVYWKDGTTQEIKGNNIAEAFTNAGIGAGAIPAVDYYKEVRQGKKKRVKKDE